MGEGLLSNAVFAFLLVLFVSVPCQLQAPADPLCPKLAASVCTLEKCDQHSLGRILKVIANILLVIHPGGKC